MQRFLLHLWVAGAGCVLALGCSFDGSSAGRDGPGGDDDGADARRGIDGAMIDGTPPVDTDADGVGDPSDNCPAVPNATQRNEDADDRGDACDLCPHRAGSVPGPDADTDGDGLGDQCDPRPGPDRLVVFLGFNEPGELAAFQSRAGANQWAITDGQLVQSDASPTTAQQLVWTGESIVGPVIVESDLHVNDVPSPGTVGTRLAAVAGGYYDPGSPPDAYACGVRATNAGDGATVAAWHFVDPPIVGASATNPMAGTMTAGLAAQVRLDVNDASPSSLDCTAAGAAVNLSVPGYVPEGYPGFRTLGTVTAFDYLFVVEVGD